jgi:hypothetical protein
MSSFFFVYDTVTIQTARNKEETWQQITTGLQHSLDHWEGGLHASGGAMVPDKTSWTLISFKWKNGNWRYQAIEDTPASLFVSDISQARHKMNRTEFNQATTSLGMEIARDGSMDAQVSRLTNASTLWASKMASSKLGGPNAWTALMSTLWKTLGYPLQATSLTRVECDKIMAPGISQWLQSMGFCRNFLRDLVHNPIGWQGLGIPHLHTTQEIVRLQALINHTGTGSYTGLLYRASSENLILETGIGTDVLSLPFLDLSPLAINSLIKTSWV